MCLVHGVAMAVWGSNGGRGGRGLHGLHGMHGMHMTGHILMKPTVLAH